VRAIVCTRYGPPEVLEQREMEKPVCNDDEVLIRVMATTVTQADLRCRGFRVPLSFWVAGRFAIGLTRPKRQVLGTEMAGVVEEVGAKVDRFQPGDDVFALTGHNGGCYAEFRSIPQNGIIAKKPNNLDYREAAALPMGALTALHFLREGGVSADQRVLIYGASGSIGTYAVQLAKDLGARVTGVCSTGNIGLVQSLGAVEVIDYTKEDVDKEADAYDVVFDTVGKLPLAIGMKVLKKGGCFLQAVGTPGMKLCLRIAAGSKGVRTVCNVMSATAVDLDFLRELVESGRVRPVIDRSYPMDQVVEAHRYADLGHKKGNVVVMIGLPGCICGTKE